ncbi:uncharacterized protein [Apostichopus japonicus]|uniref:uncharacterized protein n=1 Tax=Stichopus japonicus TaxID=307972 RepID=UPI003AB429C0
MDKSGNNDGKGRKENRHLRETAPVLRLTELMDEVQLTELWISTDAKRTKGGLSGVSTMVFKTSSGALNEFKLRPRETLQELITSLQQDQKRTCVQGTSPKSTTYDGNFSNITYFPNVSFVNLYLHGIVIFVKTLTGKTIEIAVLRSGTVQDIADQIFKKEGLPQDQMRLIYSGLQLEFTRPLSLCGITQGSVLHLVQKLRGGFEVTVTTLTGKKLSVTGVTPESNMNVVKLRIYWLYRYHPDRQIIYYENTETSDNCPVSKYSTDGSNFVVILRSDGPMNIQVQSLTGATCRLQVNYFDTIASIKSKLESSQNIPSARQQLFCVNRELKNDTTLFHNNITNDHHLTLIVKPFGYMTLYVTCTTGLVMPIEVHQRDTVKSLKAIIERKFYVSAKQQRLMKAGYILEDAKNLSDYSIESNSIIHLTVSQLEFITLHIQMRSGKMLTYRVDRTETVRNLKHLISQEEGLPADQQMILYKGTLLEDAKCLSYYEISNVCKVLLFSKLSGEVVFRLRSPAGDVMFNIGASRSDTMEAILQKIKEDSKIQIEQEQITFELQP